MDLLPRGTRIGPWSIEAKLGRGGMGTVYEVEHEATHARAALKLVSGELASEPRFRERFQREAELAAKVVHPNVVRCLGAGEDQGRLYLALELVRGGSLADRVKRGPLPWRDVARLGGEIARALEAIHAAGIVHRDLKPANVLLGPEQEAKLSDFGLARSDSLSGLTKTGELMGTVEYMAPEQTEGGTAVDARADLYALGCTLYCLLVGHPPFPGSGPEVLTKHLVALPEPPRKSVPEISPELEKIVLALLAKQPEARGGSAREVAAALEELSRRHGRPRRGRSKVALIATSLAVTTLVAASAIAMSGWRPWAPPKDKDTGPADRDWMRVRTASRYRVLETDPFVEEPPPWFLELQKSGSKPVPAKLPEGVLYGKEPGCYWNYKDRSCLVYVPGGSYRPGPVVLGQKGMQEGAEKVLSVKTGDLEFGPAREPVTLEPYFIGRYEVSNAQFERFVLEKNYKTEIERTDHVIYNPNVGRIDEFDDELWVEVHNGTNFEITPQQRPSWKSPHGTAAGGSRNKPVVQVTWEDAKAYLDWAGLRFPEELEWERAATWDGKRARTFPWGDEILTTGEVNTLDVTKGEFHLEDVDACPKAVSPVGAYNMCGNVSEWVLGAGDAHLNKGGSFNKGKHLAAPTYSETKKGCANDRGFRVALSANP